MANESLTIKQKQFLQVIKKYIDEHGFSPTVRELGQLIGLKSTSTVKGYIEKQAECPSTIRVVKMFDIYQK